jgi:hypothetical protein
MVRSLKVGIVNDRPIVGCDFHFVFRGVWVGSRRDGLGSRCIRVSSCMLGSIFGQRLKCNRRFLFGNCKLQLDVIVFCVNLLYAAVGYWFAIECVSSDIDINR